MKWFLAFFFVITAMLSCKSKKNIPDVSNIKINLQLKRFDKDLFSTDTNNIEASLNELQKKYPAFLTDYLYNILGLPPQQDSVIKKLKMFLHDYTPVYDSVEKQFPLFDEAQQQITKALQFTTYYFPDYRIPQQVITFVGPLEGYGNVLTTSGFAVGLQLYLGKNFSVYHSDYISEVYPAYRSRRFEAAYIPVNCVNNVIDDIYPQKTGSQPLIEQMIELGKRLYTLDALLPETADSLKTGYTQAQLEGCYENEGLIWNYFLQNNLLYATDPGTTQDYVNDGPVTQGLGEASPGNIGQFIGWQIVKKWMEEHNKTSLPQMLQTPAKQIFEEAKYKPR